jgi:hypothetical protein
MRVREREGVEKGGRPPSSFFQSNHLQAKTPSRPFLRLPLPRTFVTSKPKRYSLIRTHTHVNVENPPPAFGNNSVSPPLKTNSRESAMDGAWRTALEGVVPAVVVLK